MGRSVALHNRPMAHLPPFPAARRCAPLLLLAAGALLLPGCAGYYYGEKYGPTLASVIRPSLLASNRAAVERLLGKEEQRAIAPGQAVRVLPLVGVDGSGADSRFALLMAEQLAGALAQQGQRVQLPPSAPEVGQASLQGRYARSAQQVFVSLKLVHPDGQLAAAHDYALVLDEDLRSLLSMR